MIYEEDLPDDYLNDQINNEPMKKRRKTRQKYNPFDATMVHPSQYEIAKKWGGFYIFQ